MPPFIGKHIMSGTWGQLWLDDEFVAECYGMQAKVSYNKESVFIGGQMGEDSKVMSYKGTGSVRLHKVNTRMGRLLSDKIKNGIDVRFKLISKLDDPDAAGAERVAIRNVSFDDLTLIDWENNTMGKVECPFTFTDWDYLDTVV